MDRKKFRSLRSVIFKNSVLVCTAFAAMVIALLNVALPQCFYKTQKELNMDISICINDNIAEILSDINYVYSELSNDTAFVKNIISNQQYANDNDYQRYNESHERVVESLINTSFCYKNVISNVVIARNGKIFINKGTDSYLIENLMNGKNVKKPKFLKLSDMETQTDRHVLLLPFYDKSGAYICDIIFILSDEKNEVLNNQASFVIADSSGEIMLSNEDNFANNDMLCEFLEAYSTKSDGEVIDIQKIGKQEFFVTTSTIEHFAWDLLVFMPVDGFFRGIENTTIISVLIFMVLLVLIYIYTGAFSSFIGSEISEASYEINKFLNNSKVSKTRRYLDGFVKKQLGKKTFYKKFLNYNVNAVILPIVAGVICINVYYMYIINREYKNTAAVLAQMNRFKVENVYQRYNNVINYILIDEDIKQKIYEYENLSKTEQNRRKLYEKYKPLSDELYRIGRYASDYRFIYQDNYNELFVQWPENETGYYDTTAFISGSKITFDNIQNKYICSISRKVSLGTSEYFKKMGYCTLQFNAEKFMENLRALNSGGYFGIINAEGVLVASSDGKKLKKPPLMDKNSITVTQRVSGNDFSVLLKCSTRAVKNTYMFIILLSLIIICCMLVVVFLVSYNMSQYIIKPVRMVKKSLDGDIAKYIVEGKKYRDEFDELSDSINEMKNRIQTLIDDVYKYEIETKNLQMQSLRMQITPHFLYNIFEIINSMIDLKDERVGTLVLLMSDFFRRGISRNEAIVTLSDEIKYSNIYIDIQSFILEDRLEYVQQIDERCNNNMVTKFIIQPVLENIFKHGMFRKSEAIKINLTVRRIRGRETDKIKIIIRDNGVGISPDKLTALRERIYGKGNDDGGIGLKNINERLVMYYGSEYKLKIHSVEGKGTAVVIKLPCIDGE